MNRLIVLAVLVLSACAVDQTQEVQIGRENAAKINAQLPIMRDPEVAQYIQALGMEIASRTSRSDLEWQFYVVDDPSVNAFALPGGFIYVNRGLIDRTARLDELAGALGHEIGHVVRRHSVTQMQKGSRANAVVGIGCSLTGWCDNGVAQAAIQVGGKALFARYSRVDEFEADSEAVVNVARAGIDPAGIPLLFERLMEERRRAPLPIEGFFASHPMEEDRVRASQQQIAALDRATLPPLLRNTEGYQRFTARLQRLPAAARAAPPGAW